MHIGQISIENISTYIHSHTKIARNLARYYPVVSGYRPLLPGSHRAPDYYYWMARRYAMSRPELHLIKHPTTSACRLRKILNHNPNGLIQMGLNQIMDY
eukprot:1029020-Amorphochlora_amoeboformis.AAC.1